LQSDRAWRNILNEDEGYPPLTQGSVTNNPVEPVKSMERKLSLDDLPNELHIDLPSELLADFLTDLPIYPIFKVIFKSQP
jgi:hypothetical protein